MKILNSEQMRNIDRRASERYGIPSIVLMENASIAVVDAIFAHYATVERVAIFCGPGQNGGDGLAVARHLENRGVVPIVIIVGDRKRYIGDALTNLKICERLGVPIYEAKEENVDEVLVHAADADLVLDAIFGTGLTRPPEGVFAEVIAAIAELRLPVLSVDLPSGLNASVTEPFEPCLQAEVTVTFAAPKVCHVFDPSATLCGEIIVADISIPNAAIEEEGVDLALITPREIQPLVAARLAETHKGTFGHVAVIAGSPGRAGAAVLAARGAIRTGAGLVTIVTDEDTAPVVHAASIESMTYSGDDVLEFVSTKSVALIGPGLPDSPASYKNVKKLVAGIEIPLVIDASALNAFANAAGEINPNGRPRVITPHPGELARIIGSTSNDVNEDRIGAARKAARVCNCVVVLKGNQTLVADATAHVSVNPTGNPGMATGGMGDVLGGIIAAFMARDVDPFDAACVGVYLHGLAGDILKEEQGDTGLAALDLAEHMPQAIQRLRAMR